MQPKKETFLLGSLIDDIERLSISAISENSNPLTNNINNTSQFQSQKNFQITPNINNININIPDNINNIHNINNVNSINDLNDINDINDVNNININPPSINNINNNFNSNNNNDVFVNRINTNPNIINSNSNINIINTNISNPNLNTINLNINLNNTNNANQNQNQNLSHNLNLIQPNNSILNNNKSNSNKNSNVSKNVKAFKTKKTKNQLANKYKDITSIFESFKRRNATLILQQYIHEATEENLDHIINSLKGSYSQIMKDKNGNYFCSDLFKLCKVSQRIEILLEIYKSIFTDSMDMYGTHPIQSLIDSANCEEEYKLILYSFDDLKKIHIASINPNASYVVQKILRYIPEIFREGFTLNILKLTNILPLDMYGVCVMKEFFSHCSNELILNHIINIVLNNFINISLNQYGNFFIQSILQSKWNALIILPIKNGIFANFHLLAMNCYSFHICEVYINFCNFYEKQILLNTLIKNGNYNIICQNKFGRLISNKLLNSLTLGV